MIEQKILSVLKSNADKLISGEDIGKRLGVSRVSISKNIAKLRKYGYIIDTISNKGYIYSSKSDVLELQTIIEGIRLAQEDYKVYIYDEIDSTNLQAKRYLYDGGTTPAIFVANSQYNGRGRLGRDFYSPKNTGLYFSYAIKSNESIEDITFNTIIAALAVCNTLNKKFGVNVEIKWVNDIFYKNKKLAGILTEAVVSVEDMNVESAIIGIGINLNTEFFPEDISDIAISLCESNYTRNELVSDIVNNFEDLRKYDKAILIEKYKELNFLINKKINYSYEGSALSGTVVDINEHGNLIIKTEKNEYVTLISGEVTVGSKKYNEK